jgi:hypothetical protein
MNSYSSRIEIRAHRQPWIRDTIALRIAQITDHDGGEHRVAIAEPLRLRTLSDEDMGTELRETLSISPSDAQQFMDELWRVGIRPTEAAGSVGQLAAVERHLDDMRTLVFKRSAEKL